MNTAIYTPANITEERALALLGSGVSPSIAAASLGITESRISQMLSDEHFAASVAQLRYESLQRHSARDATYDELEDQLIEKMRELLPMMHRPMEVLKAIQTINGAKRRGASAPEQITQQQTVINLTIPTQIIQKFTTNIHNQVVQAGAQELLTIQSGALERMRNANVLEGNVGNKEAASAG